MPTQTKLLEPIERHHSEYSKNTMKPAILQGKDNIIFRVKKKKCLTNLNHKHILYDIQKNKGGAYDLQHVRLYWPAIQSCS